MKVRELIALLENEPPEMKVVVRGYESGYNDAVRLEHICVFLYQNTEWYFGCHAEYYAYDSPTSVEVVEIRGGREDKKSYE